MPRKAKQQAKPAKQTKLSFWLPTETLARLKQLSRETDVPMARLLRRAVNALLEQHSK